MITLLLFMVGLLAGTVDAIVGGGGLITLPILLSIGMPPHLALGTNKLQSSVGTFIAARRYYKLGLISVKSAYIGIIFGLIGAVSGSLLSQVMDGSQLKKIVPVVLIAILIYTIYSPTLGHEDIHPRMNKKIFYTLFGFVLGFYDGFMGPGTGTLWFFALTFFLGFNMVKATAYTKLFNLNSNVIALICFAIGSNIDYRTALIMAAGQIVGSRLGVSLVIRNGVTLIRPLFQCVISGTILMLLYKGYLNDGYAQFSDFSKQHQFVPLLAMMTFLLFLSWFVYNKLLRQDRKA